MPANSRKRSAPQPAAVERRRQLILKMYAEGHSQAQIGDVVKLCQQQVSKYLRLPESQAQLPRLREEYRALMAEVIAKGRWTTADPEPLPKVKPVPCKACLRRPPDVDPKKPLSAAARRLWEKQNPPVSHTCYELERLAPAVRKAATPEPPVTPPPPTLIAQAPAPFKPLPHVVLSPRRVRIESGGDDRGLGVSLFARSAAAKIETHGYGAKRREAFRP